MLFAWWLAIAPAEEWKDTLDLVTSAVVSIRMDRPLAYDGNGRGNSQATGFVIDAEKGLILTNRHVVSAGPTTAEAIFLNHEEVSLDPIYRDPVHDFGVFRFDPSELKYMEPAELSLHPEGAKVGVQIRVVGNDSGEQLSILDSTLARIDRHAPNYGAGYNDFNTFYLQAASATSGGSSGSPVVNQQGQVVGLNAGSRTSTATAYYLALDRVKRAVELIREGKEVPRGTLQGKWIYTPYDELGRLGLAPAEQERARKNNPDGTGLLVVREVLPDGPAAGKLAIGDVILEAAGQEIFDFVTLEALLDERVNKTLSVTVDRAGERKDVEMTVGDLHAITPSKVLQVGGALLHDLSYHQARGMQVALEGVSLAEAGFVFDGIPTHAVIVELNGEPTGDLVAFEKKLAAIPHGESFTIRYYRRGVPKQRYVRSLRMDRRAFPMKRCDREDERGTWPCTDSPAVGDAEPKMPPKAELFPADDKQAKAVLPSIVWVTNRIPYEILGVQGDSFTGAGLVLDAERGLVVVDRDTVPISHGIVHVVVAGAAKVPAEVVGVHPTHNLTLLRYDPASLAEFGLKSAVLADDEVETGDKLWAVPMKQKGVIRSEKVNAEDAKPVNLPMGNVPRFRQMHVDTIAVKPKISGYHLLTTKKGEVAAFHASISYTSGSENKAYLAGHPAWMLREALQLADEGTTFPALGFELGAMPVKDALEQGLPVKDAETLLAHDPERRNVLFIKRLEAGNGAADGLRVSDLVVRIDGKVINRFGELAALPAADTRRLEIIRNGQRMEVEVPVEQLDGKDTSRVILWAGLRLHEVHRGARFSGIEPTGVYVSWRSSGSPANRTGVYAVRTIRSVDGMETSTLDAFLKAVDGRKKGESVRLELVNAHGEKEVVTVRVDPEYWPTEELVPAEGGWIRRRL